MELESYFDFLAPGDIRVKGTRIGIETILCILVLHPNMTLNAIIDELLLIWGASEASEYCDLLLYLPLTY
jgi:hypothetical protein